MRGEVLLEILSSQLFAKNDSNLAELLGVSAARISQIRKTESLGDRTVNSLIRQSIKAKSAALLENAVRPVVEFFPTESLEGSDRTFLDTTQEDRRQLQRALRASRGIYCFYNSELEIIYVGKTKGDLWTEMHNAYNREMKHYSRYYVAHAYEKYVVPKGGGVRKITKGPMHLYDAAEYFSAYSVEEDLIDAIEQLIIRMIPNDLLNVRMEGNTSMSSFSPELNEG